MTRQVLIIHNNNIPIPIRELERSQEQDMGLGFEFTTLVIGTPRMGEDYDSYLYKKFRDEEKKLSNDYDLIILPYSLSEENPLEYSGIRCAAHIRLFMKNPNWNTPFLFIGPDQLEELLRMCILVSFLVTPGVFRGSFQDQKQLLSFLCENETELFRPLSEEEYSIFIRKFSVPAPANLATGHHSTTNLWTIVRWQEMLTWTGDKVLEPSKQVSEFSNSLYCKWLLAKTGKREKFSKKKKVYGVIPSIIKNPKIVYIDDELDSGWGDLMKTIFQHSSMRYVPFVDFDKRYTRREFLERLKSFVDDNDDADCFILDLRLHEEDQKKNENSNLFTGHQIAQYIYEKNKGNQIVFFTASNKSETYKKAEQYMSDYVKKEDPRLLLSNDESHTIYNGFAQAIQKACANSYLKEYYNVCRGKAYLEDFFELLRFFDEKAPAIQKRITLRSAALNLCVFIESTTKKSFSIYSNKLHWGTNSIDVSRVYLVKSDGIICSVIDDGYEHTDSNKYSQSTSDLFLVCSVLLKVFELPVVTINQYITLKIIRNSSIAHHSSNMNGKALDSDVTIDLLKSVFDGIALPLLKNPITASKESEKDIS